MLKVFDITETVSNIIIENNVRVPYTIAEKYLTITNKSEDDTDLIFQIVQFDNVVLENKIKNTITIPFNTTVNWSLYCKGKYEVYLVIGIIH